MLFIYAVLLFIWLLGVIAICTFCVAAARADRLTRQDSVSMRNLVIFFPGYPVTYLRGDLRPN